MRYYGIIILVLILSCGTGWAGPKESGGALLGAASGAIIGSQIGDGKGQVAAILIGTLAGTVIGHEVGRSLDQADRLALQQNNQIALETNRSNYSSTWVNPDTGHSGSLTPVRTFKNAAGRYCREYQTTIIIDGQRQQAYGTACRQNDGFWQIAAAERPVEVRQVTRVRYVDPAPYVAYRYRDPYRYGYYSPVRGFFSIGFFSHNHGHKHHYSRHRSRGDHYKNIHQRGYRSRWTGHRFY